MRSFIVKYFLVSVLLFSCKSSEQLESTVGPKVEQPIIEQAYVVGSEKWTKSTITYALQGTWDLRYKKAIDMAFIGIESVIPIQFQLISSSSTADIKISGFSGDHLSTIRGRGYAVNGVFQNYWIEINLNQQYFSGDNYLLYSLMKAVAKSVGMRDNLNITNALLGRGPNFVNGFFQLYYLQQDDILGLQSIYGPISVANPSFDHRHHIRTKIYLNQRPHPNAPPIGWVYTSESYPTWPKLLNRFDMINTEQFKLEFYR